MTCTQVLGSGSAITGPDLGQSFRGKTVDEPMRPPGERRWSQRRREDGLRQGSRGNHGSRGKEMSACRGEGSPRSDHQPGLLRVLMPAKQLTGPLTTVLLGLWPQAIAALFSPTTFSLQPMVKKYILLGNQRHTHVHSYTYVYLNLLDSYWIPKRTKGSQNLTPPT